MDSLDNSFVAQRAKQTPQLFTLFGIANATTTVYTVNVRKILKMQILLSFASKTESSTCK